MRNNQIQLRTIHSPVFSITKGFVDHTKSLYYQKTAGVKEAYYELWKRLKTPKGQIIWCYTEGNKITKAEGEEKILWTLQIPCKEVICFLDSLVWNRILKIKCRVTRTMRQQWINEAAEKYPEDTHSQESYIDQCEKDFWDQKPKTGSWWEELLVQGPSEGIDAIIHHPVPEIAINGREPWYVKPRGSEN